MKIAITIVICITIYAVVEEICEYLKHKKDKEVEWNKWKH